MRPISDAELEKKKFITARRAEFRLRQRLEALQWERDTLAPEVAQIEAGITKGLIIEASLVELDEKT